MGVWLGRRSTRFTSPAPHRTGTSRRAGAEAHRHAVFAAASVSRYRLKDGGAHGAQRRTSSSNCGGGYVGLGPCRLALFHLSGRCRGGDHGAGDHVGLTGSGVALVNGFRLHLHLHGRFVGDFEREDQTRRARGLECPAKGACHRGGPRGCLRWYLGRRRFGRLGRRAHLVLPLLGDHLLPGRLRPATAQTSTFAASVAVTGTAVSPLATPPVVTVSSTPIITSVTPANGQLTVGFVAPAEDPPAYEFIATCGGLAASVPVVTPIAVPGLTNGVSVPCTVSEENDDGTDPPSPAVSGILSDRSPGPRPSRSSHPGTMN